MTQARIVGKLYEMHSTIGWRKILCCAVAVFGGHSAPLEHTKVSMCYFAGAATVYLARFTVVYALLVHQHFLCRILMYAARKATLPSIT